MTTFEKIFSIISELDFELNRGTETYEVLEELTKDCVSNSGFATNGIDNLGYFGSIHLPYLKMGSINTLDLFGLDEMLLFAWYKRNQKSYQNVADLGANVGLHSILMSKLGWTVSSYEADPETTAILENNLKLNESRNVSVHNLAVSTFDGKADFVRVENNLTGSHLAGAKKSPYGALKTFQVSTISIERIMNKCDFFKMDVEGSEAEIIKATNTYHWHNVDAIIEIGSIENSKIIFEHLNNINVKMYSQKNSWRIVTNLDQLPAHHTEGLVFCSIKRNFLE